MSARIGGVRRGACSYTSRRDSKIADFLYSSLLNGVPILYSVAYRYCIVALPDVHNTLVVAYLIMRAYNNNHISEFLSLTAAV